MGTANISGRAELTNLQTGRAVAAFAVVLAHASTSMPAFGQALPPALAGPFFYRFLGVDFFFVLSGFIIFYQHGADERSWPAARNYLTKRLLRIYLPYLPIAVALLALFTVAPGLAGSGRNWGPLTSLTLLPSSEPSVISIAWTMVHEVAFYAIFLIFYLTPAFEFVIAGWAGVIVVLWLGGYRALEYGNNWPEVFLAPINLEFVGGMIAARLARPVSPSWWPMFLGAGCCLVAAYFCLGEDRVLFGLGTVGIVLGVVLLERSGFGSPRWLASLGDASYAVYLLHLTIFSVVLRVTARFASWPIGLAVAVLAVAAAGLAYHRFFERPALEAARERLLPGRPVAATAD